MNGRDILRPIAAVATAAGAFCALLAAEPARAQFPDVLSADECPGCAAAWVADNGSRFAGVWSSALTSATDPAWAPEDFACFIACTPAARARAATAPLREIAADGDAYPLFEFACDLSGFAAQVVSPLPLKIEVSAERVVLSYEEHAATRALPLAARELAVPGEPSLLGTSTARFEQGSLVVETRGIAARRFYGWFGGRPTGDRLRATERYTTSADGAWLHLTLEFVDPDSHAAPLMLTKRWRRVPRVEIAHYGCDVMSGQLQSVFAEYVDPSIVEERRASSALQLTAVPRSDARR
jgi:hypothetical protein